MRNVRMTIWLVVVVCAMLFGGLAKVSAEIVYDFGGEYDIGFEINDVLTINDNLGGTPTIVSLVAGGIIKRADARVRGNSIFNIVGGWVDYDVLAYDNSQVNLSGGGLAYDLHGYHDSVFTVSGGVIERDLLVNHNNETLITGGSIGGNLDVYDDSVVTIEGTGFNYPYGGITNSTGILFGTLANGDLIYNRFYVHDNASIILVPEPTTLLLLGLGGLMLRRER